jgi:hypothetical protein
VVLPAPVAQASKAVVLITIAVEHGAKPPERLRVYLYSALSPDFDFVLAKALSKDPTRRHHSARDLDVDLETLEYSHASSPRRA